MCNHSLWSSRTNIVVSVISCLMLNDYRFQNHFGKVSKKCVVTYKQHSDYKRAELDLFRKYL